MALDEGTEISIGDIVREYLKSKQYSLVYIDNKYGWIWTKDNGLTYIIKDSDLFKVMDIVEKKLSKLRILDFSKYDSLYIGLPYNIPFIIKYKFSSLFCFSIF